MFHRLACVWRKICRIHRSKEDPTGVVDFFFPRLSPAFFIRAAVVALVAAVLFGFILKPCFIDGGSMLPNWPVHGFTFCNTLHYHFHKMQYGDVAVVKYSSKIFYLKRIVGLEGDMIEFRRGRLFRNGKEVEESYVKYRSRWGLAPRKVQKGHVYVVGDNRSQRMSEHKFGQVRIDRIIGAPLF